jgi:hypothetical protein
MGMHTSSRAVHVDRPRKISTSGGVSYFQSAGFHGFVCLFVWVNKASQGGTPQRHPGIELFSNTPMFGGYDLGCHRRFPVYRRRGLHPFTRTMVTDVLQA